MNSAEGIRKPHVFLSRGGLNEIVEEIEAALVARDGALRQHEDVLYLETPYGPKKVDAQLLRLRAMQAAGFYRLDRQGNFEDADPPLKYFAALLRKGTWGFPQLDAAPK
jgi:hypothetical protein